MYLASQRKGAAIQYYLRESYSQGERTAYRELFDLGNNPANFIVYPGGNSFYFDQDLVDTLQKKGVTETDRKLEEIFMPFLKPHIQRIIGQMTKFNPKKRAFSKKAFDKLQADLHLFDRRRLHYLRFGRVDSLKVLMYPHKFLRVLLEKSRDEIEYYFRDMENNLRIREKKNYLFHSLDLSSHFPGEISRLFPQSLDQDELDEVFISQICYLNQDRKFLDIHPDREDGSGILSDYLIHYVIMWFDYEFGQKSLENHLFDEFIRSRRQYRPPTPPPEQRLDLDKALKIFELTREEWQTRNSEELKRIYRRKAMDCHPDQGGCQEDFVELKQAYETLINGK